MDCGFQPAGLYIHPTGPKGRRPSDAKGGGGAADQGRQAAGPSEQRALKRSAARRSRSGGPKKIELE